MKEVFSERLKEARLKLNLNQRRVSEAANISPASYSAYEKSPDGKMPPLDIAFRIATALGVSLDWLCGGTIGPSVRTYADVVMLLREIADSIDVDLEVEQDVDSYPEVCKMVLYRIDEDKPINSTWGITNDISDIEFDFARFFSTWGKMMPLMRSGEFDSSVFDPWFQEQYKKLNILLPKYSKDEEEDEAPNL